MLARRSNHRLEWWRAPVNGEHHASVRSNRGDTAPEPAIETGPAKLHPAWSRLTSLSGVDRRVGLSWLSGLGFNSVAPVDILLSLLDIGETGFLGRTDLPAGVVDAAVVHPTRLVRRCAAEYAQLSAVQWKRFVAASPEPELGSYAAERLAIRQLSRGGRGVELAPFAEATPPTTPGLIAAMASEVPDIDPQSQTTALWWIGALHDNADAMRQLAESPKLLVRRSVARAPRLPADVVALLAGDEDRSVRLFLAESCDDAPPELLLEVASWWQGSFSFPGRPREHPNFPRNGLVRFSADPNPLLRALALDDPASTAELVEHFSSDPDPIVRRAAAEDRRLSPEAAVRLTDDTDQGVYWRILANPALPPESLVLLLLDSRPLHVASSAEIAVRNPTIPIPVLRHMLAVAAPLVEDLRRAPNGT